MAFQVSPGVNVTEFDLTTIIPAPIGPTGAIVGEFPWGPINIAQPIDSEIQLVERFGKPAISGNAAATFFTAANYLNYASSAVVIRSEGSGAYNAVANSSLGAGAAVLIKNSDAYSNSFIENTTTVNNGVFAARYAGAIGNNLDVSIFGNTNESAFNNWAYKGFFDRKPGTTYYVAEKYNANANDEVYIVVVDRTGVLSGQAGTVLEKFAASKASNARDENNNSLYYRDVLFNKSRWIYWIGHPEYITLDSGADTTVAVNTANADLVSTYVELDYSGTADPAFDVNQSLHFVSAADSSNNFYATVVDVVDSDTINVRIDVVNTGDDAASQGGGLTDWTINFSGYPGDTDWGDTADATNIFKETYGSGDNLIHYTLSGGADGTVVKANVQNSMDILREPTVDVNFICIGPYTDTAQHAIQVAEDRKDCMAFISPPLANVQSAAAADSVVDFRESINYSSSYGVMDSGWKYQYDKYNDTYRYTPLNGDIAGLCARTDATNDPWFSPAGQVRGQIRNIVRLAWNPNKTDRDALYRAGVNPVCTFQGEGTYLFGDKTLLARPSAFDRINVRRLFITLEKTIARAARGSLFEFNDDFTRSQFVSLVEPYLRSVQAGRGVYDFRVVCDDRNNTPDVIDRNQFVGDIFIKPSRSINFIQLNFVALRTGVSFEEIVGAV